MDDNLFLLVNPSRYKTKKIVNQASLDESIILLLNKKFPKVEITKEDYNENIIKIETLFTETYNQRIIITVIEEIIRKTENEQVLF